MVPRFLISFYTLNTKTGGENKIKGAQNTADAKIFACYLLKHCANDNLFLRLAKPLG